MPVLPLRRRGPRVLLLALALVLAVTAVPLATPAPADAAPTGAPMVLEFTATASGQWPIILLGQNGIDTTETVRVKVNLGETGDPATSTEWIITLPGLYSGDDVVAPLTPITYPGPGTYTVTISPLLAAEGGSDTGPWLTLYGAYRAQSGNNPGSAFYDGSAPLTRVVSFGDLGITGLSHAFADQTSFVDVPATLPDGLTHLNGTFMGATSFDDADVSGWNVSSVTATANLFENASAFDRPLASWDVANVIDMSDMFEDAIIFNRPLAAWNVANVTDMSNMFEGALAFDQPIGGWDVSSVTNMGDMFKQTDAFDQPIGAWVVSSVTDMNDMFEDATAFNQPIGGWDVSSVTDTSAMFQAASSFDQPLADWDVSNVGDMSFMFSDATSFDRSLASWQLRDDVYLDSMLDGSGMSSSCYDATLVGWAALSPAVTGRTLDASGVNYSPTGEAARATLTGDRGWAIADDGRVDTATGRCLEGDVAPASAAPAGPQLACLPGAPAVGATVTCTVSGGDPDVEILWEAGASAPFASLAVRLGPDGVGTFAFTVPPAALGQTIGVQLVAWGVDTALPVSGPVPTAVRAGGGPGERPSLPAGAWVALAALGLTGVLRARRIRPTRP